jgi:hypothetical protein
LRGLGHYLLLPGVLNLLLSYFSAVGLNVVGLAGGFYYLNKNGSVDVNQMLRSPLGKEVTKLIKKNIKTPRL